MAVLEFGGNVSKITTLKPSGGLWGSLLIIDEARQINVEGDTYRLFDSFPNSLTQLSVRTMADAQIPFAILAYSNQPGARYLVMRLGVTLPTPPYTTLTYKIDSGGTQAESRSSVLESTTIAYWPLNDPVGTIHDWKGTYDSVSQAAAYGVAGPLGGGISLVSRRRNKVLMADIAELAGASAAHLSLWVKRSKVGGVIIAAAPTGDRFGIKVSNDGYVHCYAENDGVGASKFPLANGDRSWHKIDWVFQNGSVAAYLDGQPQTLTSESAFASTLGDSIGWGFGYEDVPAGTDVYSDGDVADVMLSTEISSSGVIAERYLTETSNGLLWSMGKFPMADPISYGFPIGFWGNAAMLLYSPKIDDHPSVEHADGVAANTLFINSFDLFPEQDAEVNAYINGLPDRNVWTPKGVTVKGPVSQKMIANIDGFPDYTLARIIEHCRHAWEGYQFSVAGDGSGVQGIPGSLYPPKFTLMSDLFGVYAGCMVDSVELVANNNEQVEVNYQLVARRIWPEDAQAVRNLMSVVATDPELMAMTQVYSTDCGVLTQERTTAGNYLQTFGIPSSGSSPFLSGYNTPLTPTTEYIEKMSLKIENFLKPNFTMSSRRKWGKTERFERNLHAHERFIDNMWPRDWYPSQPRQISGQISWITDVFPYEIYQKTLGLPINQIIDQTVSHPEGVLLGQDLWMIFGPLQVWIKHPVWNLSRPELRPDNKFKITAKMTAATDGELIFGPTVQRSLDT